MRKLPIRKSHPNRSELPDAANRTLLQRVSRTQTGKGPGLWTVVR
jgi:hypothetical protein